MRRVGTGAVFGAFLSGVFPPRPGDLLEAWEMAEMAPRVRRFDGCAMLICIGLLAVLAPAVIYGLRWLNRAYPLGADHAVLDTRGPEHFKSCVTLAGVLVLVVHLCVVTPLWWRHDLTRYLRYESTKNHHRALVARTFVVLFLVLCAMVIVYTSWDFGVRVDANGIVAADCLTCDVRQRLGDVREMAQIGSPHPAGGLAAVEILRVKFVDGSVFELSSGEGISTEQVDEVGQFIRARSGVAVERDPLKWQAMRRGAGH